MPEFQSINEILASICLHLSDLLTRILSGHFCAPIPAFSQPKLSNEAKKSGYEKLFQSRFARMKQNLRRRTIVMLIV